MFELFYFKARGTGDVLLFLFLSFFVLDKKQILKRERDPNLFHLEKAAWLSLNHPPITYYCDLRSLTA